MKRQAIYFLNFNICSTQYLFFPLNEQIDGVYIHVSELHLV